MFANNLRMARERKGLTQSQLADKINVSAVLVNRFEAGMSVPNLILGVKLAKVLGVTCEELVNGERKN